VLRYPPHGLGYGALVCFLLLLSPLVLCFEVLSGFLVSARFLDTHFYGFYGDFVLVSVFRYVRCCILGDTPLCLRVLSGLEGA
jgi:hypothetical protein